MAYDTDMPAIPDEKLLSRRPWYVIGALLILASLLLRQPLLFIAALLIAALGAVPEIWYRFCLSAVKVRRTFSAQRAEIGDEILLTLTIENGKLLPLPHLDIEDEVPEEGLSIRGGYLETSVKPLRAILVNTLSLWAFQRVTRRYRVRCLARGVYTFGPIKLESGDPFGLLTREAALDDEEHLLVYPLTVPLARLGLPSRAPFGERPTPRRLLEDPLQIAGARPYVLGDDPRRIHWKATARTATLQSKVYEPSAHHTLVLFVDLRTYTDPTRGYDPALLELALCAAASVATWGIEHGYAVGLYANGMLLSAGAPELTISTSSRSTGDDDTLEHVRAAGVALLHAQLAPSARPEQLVRIQQALARVFPYWVGPMAGILARELKRLPTGSTAVYIGAARTLDDEGIALLEQMRRHGHAVTTLLTGAETVDTGRVPVMRLGDANTWHELYAETLAEHGLDERGRPSPAERGQETEQVSRRQLVLEAQP
jgi:uncharacterized protein (DUF58 family)